MGHVCVKGWLRTARGGRVLPGAGVALLSIALGAVLLAACGSVPAPGAGGVPAASASGSGAKSPAASSPSSAGTSQVALCRDAAAVTSLRIVRIPGGKVPREQAVVPVLVAVVGPVRAREVARALCALPAMPRGIFNCPALFPGTTYQLTFTADGQQLPPVNVDATGCETVTGVGPVRRALPAQFWRVLAVAAGVSPRSQSGFASPGCLSSPAGVKINGCPGLSQPGGAAQSGSAAVS